MLDTGKLQCVKRAGDKIIAQCPACHDDGSDHGGVHLVYWPGSGKYGCAAHPRDKPHRQRIWALVGVRDGKRGQPRLSREQLERGRTQRAEGRHSSGLAAAAARAATRIFAQDWPLADLWSDSPLSLGGAEPDWHLLLGRLFSSDATTWIGERTDSGPRHHFHFRTVREWIEGNPAGPPYPLTCPDVFQPGSFRRNGQSVETSPFLVVEADSALGYKPATAEERTENIRRNLCVLRWLKESLSWSLRAVIHTGGKSCHGWFDRPPEKHIAELRTIAPALGIDPSVFTPGHPVRLPGVRHEKTGTLSRLLYLG